MQKMAVVEKAMQGLALQHELSLRHLKSPMSKAAAYAVHTVHPPLRAIEKCIRMVLVRDEDNRNNETNPIPRQ